MRNLGLACLHGNLYRQYFPHLNLNNIAWHEEEEDDITSVQPRGHDEMGTKTWKP
jgi:hypothetical protein